ncbi:MAG: Rz1-like lysis system protein LysC [Acinetobacter sp.]|uniref:Rz1-like lysis system protein LysC n=1 Tax=Acinetobacter sp. TaxID=472 RepID=UPI00391A6321
MLSAACSTVPEPPQTSPAQVIYPMLTPCHKPLLNIQVNEDFAYALETTELARALCAAKVDSIIQIQEQHNEKAR